MTGMKKILSLMALVLVISSSGCVGYLAARPATKGVLVLQGNQSDIELRQVCYKECAKYLNSWSDAQRNRWHCDFELIRDEGHEYAECMLVPMGDY